MSEIQPAETPHTKPSEKGTQISKIWVPVILIIAVLLGLVLAETVPSPVPCPENFPFCIYSYNEYLVLLSIQRAIMLHVILSTIEMVLLVSLVVVYVRVYLETRANFSLGLLIMLGALTIYSFLSYPLVVGYAVGSEFFPYADLLTIVAYSIFLYLSLG